MSRRRVTSTTRALSLGAAGLLLLAGCWTSDTASTSTDTPGEAATSAAPSSAAPSPTAAAPTAAPEPACPAGSPEATTYECAGVTVTGAKDAEPTVTLGEGFAPVSELAVADVYPGGAGDPVQPGATLTVNYVGVGQQSGAAFDSSWPPGQPETFPLDGVIQGWRQGLLGMTPGGRRLLVIPASLAYGAEGRPPVIAPDETLVFVVDLVAQTPAA